MRFEMNSEDVLGLSAVLHYAMKHMDENPALLNVNTLHSLGRLIEKIRNYGYEAYPNREVFRQDMNDLKSWREELLKKRLK